MVMDYHIKITRLYALSILILLFIATSSSAGGDCQVCSKAFRFIWPVNSYELVTDRYLSVCTAGYEEAGQWGYDLYAPDGDNVFASFDGVVDATFEDPNFGCVLKLKSNPINGVTYIAYYGYLMKDGMKQHGDPPVLAGDVIAHAGGGQDDPICRGDSPGARLYYELDTEEGEEIDPFTCVADSCRFWYTSDGTSSGQPCVPQFTTEGTCIAVSKSSGEGYFWPTYACTGQPYGGVTVGGVDNRYYAQVTVDAKGRLDMSCFTQADGKERCMSEVYDNTVQPLFANRNSPRDLLNCFMKFLRAHSDGSVDCGKLLPSGEINWGAGHMTTSGVTSGACMELTSMGIAYHYESKNEGYIALHQITKPENPLEELAWLVVGAEYTLIGADDSDVINKMTSNRRYLDTDSANPEQYTGFNAAVTPYSTDYILVRTCDLAGMQANNLQCKTSRFVVESKYLASTLDYDSLVDMNNFKGCTYDLFDAGKFYDEPGRYIGTFWLSKLTNNKGKQYYG